MILQSHAMVKESVLLMELAYVNLYSTETDAQVNLEHWGINICFISALTFFIYIFFIAGCHYFFTCSDHGSCRNDGTCQCDEGFYNDSCSSKHDKLLLQQVTVLSFSSLPDFLVLLNKAWLNHS